MIYYVAWLMTGYPYLKCERITNFRKSDCSATLKEDGSIIKYDILLTRFLGIKAKRKLKELHEAYRKSMYDARSTHKEKSKEIIEWLKNVDVERPKRHDTQKVPNRYCI